MNLTFVDERLHSVVEPAPYSLPGAAVFDRRPPLDRLALGMTADEVRQLMGHPNKQSMSLRGQRIMTHWSYERLTRPGDWGVRVTTSPKFDLTFEDQKLVRIEESR